ncbi:MAG TPA: nuclear transport factor 2 family protein [Candidatus Angelobacter sp.]|jgi:ketosteroid isomerase-like protein|nr:nuclear transport factor 2 family protein [Candidatus Angelobacter sp.]
MVRDDQYEISAAKTEYREAYNSGDVERLLSVFEDGFTDCSANEPSYYGAEARRALELRSRHLFCRYKVELFVIIIDIVVKGDFAFDWGWHKMRLIDKQSGEITDTKYRYFEIWNKSEGNWKIHYIITNKEMPPQMLPEEENAASHSAVLGKAAS